MSESQNAAVAFFTRQQYSLQFLNLSIPYEVTSCIEEILNDTNSIDGNTFKLMQLCSEHGESLVEAEAFYLKYKYFLNNINEYKTLAPSSKHIK